MSFFCDPSIANCRSLTAFGVQKCDWLCVLCEHQEREFRKTRYRELCAVLCKMCGLEWESESKAEYVLGVQLNWFGSWYVSFRLCTLCLMFK